MKKIQIHPEKIADFFLVFDLCPYHALKFDDNGKLIIGNECQRCMVCVNNGPQGAFESVEI